MRNIHFLCIALATLAETMVAQRGPLPPLPIEPTKVFVLDLKGDGFQLSSAADGVDFDVDGTGQAVRTAWTARSSDDGFLVLDLNGNRLIDSGREMIGSAWRTAQGNRVTGNEALRLIQDLDGKGRAAQTPAPGPREVEVDGKKIRLPNLPPQDFSSRIGPEDEVYTRLRVWVDRNHNGRSETDELFPLPTLKIIRLSLGFRKPAEPPQDPHRNRTWLIGTFSTGDSFSDEKRMNYLEFARR